MEVMPGYKQTEAGVIPQHWDTFTVLEITRQIVDFRGRTPKKLGMDWGGGDIPALSAGNVRMGFIDLSEECYFGSENLYKRWMTKGDIAKGDIVFTTEAPLGNVALIQDDRKYILSQRTILLQVDRHHADSRFIFQIMLSERFQKLLSDHSSGSTAKGIQRKKFEQLTLACPPIEEQRSIATALSDFDALIAGLEKLIAKKRDIKQAAMQQLLTGQTRLPGFNGNWAIKLLGDICDIGMGRTPPRLNQEYWGRGYKWLSIADLKSKVVCESKEEITQAAASMLEIIPKGTLLMSFKLSIGRLCFAGCDLFTNEAICNFKNLRENADFLYYALGRTDFSLYGKQAVKGYTLNKESLQRVEVLLPPRAEQDAIAEALTSLDTELEALAKRLEKIVAIKQGMMQELLTGRTRLI